MGIDPINREHIFTNTLDKKLVINPGNIDLLLNPPENYEYLIGGWPNEISFMSFKQAEEMDFIHFFTQELAGFETTFLKKKMRKGGMHWISWPKGKSKLPKDLNGNDVGRIGLENSMVDVKVCSVDKDWSGLKFVFSTKDR